MLIGVDEEPVDNILVIQDITIPDLELIDNI